MPMKKIIWLTLLVLLTALVVHHYYPAPQDFFRHVAEVSKARASGPTRHAPASKPLFASQLTADQVAALREAVAPLMAMSVDEVAALVPVQGGITYTDCPACDYGVQDKGNFIWSPMEPGKITCRDCGAVYPDNPNFPETGVLEVDSFGETHSYPYHEPESGNRMYFAAKADDMAREYLAARCLDLARLWWATGEDAYAARAAAILVRFAEVYPGYAMKYDVPYVQKIVRPPDSGYIRFGHEHPNWELAPTRTGKWSWWGYMDLSQDLTYAYDLLRFWPPFREMADGVAPFLVEEDLLGAMLDWTLAYREDFTNMAPTKWRGAVLAARVLRRPEPVHEVIDRVEAFFAGRFHYDGSWFETSPSYMLQVYGNIGVIAGILDGYEDPEGYVHPDTGRRISSADVTALLSRRDAIYETIMATRLPDGRLLPVNDTWWQHGRRAPRESMEAVLAPGFGVAVLGGGQGENQIHAWLNFTSGRHHNQWSSLSVSLWANGREWLSDVGYTHTTYRYWATSTSSHNTVTVDGRDQQFDADYLGNRLRLWVDAGNGFQSAEAESTTAYPHLSRYRRNLMLIGEDARDGYLVDVFQVRGGKQHDFILAGNANEETEVSLDRELTPFNGTLLNPGVVFTKPTASGQLGNRAETGLGYIINLRFAPDAEQVRFDTRLKAEPNLGVRSWVNAGAGTVVYLGEAPAVRPAGESEARRDDFLMPMLVARRQTDHSVFVAVHEPIADGRSAIDAVDVERRDDAVVLSIRREATTDVLFVAMDEQATLSYATPNGKVDFAGRQGMLRIRDGKPVAMHLVGGTLLRFGGTELTGAESVRGKITGIGHGQTDGSGWFDIAEQVDPAMAVSALITRLPDGTTQAYNIAAIEATADGSRILVREAPAIDITADKIAMRYFPLREITGGTVTYELIPSLHRIID